MQRHGPKPGSAESRARAASQSLPADRSISPPATAATSAANAARRERGHPQVFGVHLGQRLQGREQVGEPALLVPDQPAVLGCQPPGEGLGRRGRHMLAEHSPYRGLGPVHAEAAYAVVRRVATEMTATGTYASLTDAVDYNEFNALMRG